MFSALYMASSINYLIIYVEVLYIFKMLVVYLKKVLTRFYLNRFQLSESKSRNKISPSSRV